MKATTGKKKKGSDTDKAIAKPGLESPKKENTSESHREISLDTIIAEKDEVKIAEERLRQRNKDIENGKM
ncbi:hypothetical protein [Daejeonella sp.]|uniref:hypothetical protein n=1 Tax=Daejeonella sp. TaxID=2805397 RepID=UPI0030BBA5ED